MNIESKSTNEKCSKKDMNDLTASAGKQTKVANLNDLRTLFHIVRAFIGLQVIHLIRKSVKNTIGLLDLL